MDLRRFVPPAVLVLFAVGAGWILKNLSPDELVPVEQPPHVPDVYVEDFVTLKMDPQGNPRSRLEATA